VLFWKILKNSTDEISPNERSKTPSQSQWLNHFKTLHSEHTITKKQKETLKLLKESEKFKDQFNDLDKPITEEELPQLGNLNQRRLFIVTELEMK
jgi:hypothetical protein